MPSTKVVTSRTLVIRSCSAAEIISVPPAIAAAISATMSPATVAVAAAMVIGTRKRRQCSQAPIAPAAALAAITSVPPVGLLLKASSPIPAIRPKPTVATTPPTKASSRTMLGSAIRRWRVKNSARPQAVAATNRPMNGVGPS